MTMIPTNVPMRDLVALDPISLMICMTHADHITPAEAARRVIALRRGEAIAPPPDKTASTEPAKPTVTLRDIEALPCDQLATKMAEVEGIPLADAQNKAFLAKEAHPQAERHTLSFTPAEASWIAHEIERQGISPEVARTMALSERNAVAWAGDQVLRLSERLALPNGPEIVDRDVQRLTGGRLCYRSHGGGGHHVQELRP